MCAFLRRFLWYIYSFFPIGQWFQLPDFPNYNKWGYSVVSLNSNVYVTGELDNLLIGWFGLYASNHNTVTRKERQKKKE